MGKILSIIVIVLAIVIFGPIATIWSLNTLFGFAIPISLDTWLSAFWLSAIVGGTTAFSRKK